MDMVKECCVLAGGEAAYDMVDISISENPLLMRRDLINFIPQSPVQPLPWRPVKPWTHHLNQKGLIYGPPGSSPI
jgi:hypothetical protein